MTDLASYRQIAILHKRSIPHGFLSSLRIESLAAIYRALDSGHGNVVLTLYDEDILTGFVGVNQQKGTNFGAAI